MRENKSFLFILQKAAHEIQEIPSRIEVQNPRKNKSSLIELNINMNSLNDILK